MPSSTRRPEPPYRHTAIPPYRQIVAEIRARILAGDLRPGDRVPSIREIARRWGVAVATATRVMATLRDDGLVETKVGAGTVVSTLTGQKQPVGVTTPLRPRRAGVLKQALNRKRTLRTAIAIAGIEGLDAVSMRRLAAEFGVGPMSLYRHVSSKDELVTQMADEVFGEPELPVPGSDGWRAKLELISRLQMGAVPATPLAARGHLVHSPVAGAQRDGAHRVDPACTRRARTAHDDTDSRGAHSARTGPHRRAVHGG